MITTDELPPHLIKAVEAGVGGLDVLQGELKNLMYETEKNLEAARNNEPLLENEYDESDEYYLGYLDALTSIYILNYKIQFAIEDWEKTHGNN